jgi:SHS2 domain-containing protein
MERERKDIEEEPQPSETRTRTPSSSEHRGPTAEKERLIEERIEQRRQTMEQSRAINSSYEPEDEILLGGKYEYLDHTADIQLHGWGDSLEHALEQVAIAMFGYMTSLSRIHVNETQSEEIAKNILVTGHDVQSLAFAFLQEWLYIFHESGFVAKEIHAQPIDRDNFNACTSSGKGEVADWKRHTQGTEIKAVTYSNLQVKEEDGRCDIWVIVDI